VLIQRSAIALARGARTGVRRMWTPSLAKTVSKVSVNLVSRSRIRRRRRDKPAWRRWKSSTSKGERSMAAPSHASTSREGVVKR
jgi:hypothetical protein